MRFAILAALSGAALAAYQAHPLLLQAAQQQGCDLPQQFHITSFCGQSNNTSDSPAPSFFHFNYTDPASKVDTSCRLNATSRSTTPEGLTPRYACENRDVKFIWQQDHSKLTIVERACRSPQGYVFHEFSKQNNNKKLKDN